MKYNKYTTESLREEALKYTSSVDFLKNSYNAFQAALRRGIVDQICSHMKFERKFWTDAELTEEALKYSTRGEFASKNRSAYRVADKRNILDKICSHMNYAHQSWTLEMLQESALKYITRKEFSIGSPKEYYTATRRGIVDQICSHMKPSRGSSGPERELLSIIKDKYSSAKKTRDTKVKIEGKPYIHKFEIDIFVPELNKGIEFDGRYHHSPEWLAKKKGKWPLEDALNKHQIKDSWFLSKGIQILHIKEQDWIDNKEDCIKCCFEFLSK